MSVSLRAAAFAVATLVVAATATYAPSLAWEADAAPAVPAFAVHSAAAIQDGTALLNPIDPATGASAPNSADLPVAQHAIAPLGSEADAGKPALGEEEEEKVLAPVKTLSALVDDHDEKELDAELECLAGAVYFESKGEPLEGQLAVAEVIINRAKSGRFPSTFCGVVKQRGQFSFVRGGKFPPIARGSAHWRKAVGVAHVAIQDLADSKVNDALFFHARRVSPGWKLKRLATVGNHVFYR